MKQFAKKIIRHLQRVQLNLRGEIDAKRLSKMFPELTNYKRLLQADGFHLKSAYDRYISDISTMDMAVSWETSNFLYTIARKKRPRKILDLGSGFSSYVLRSYSLNVQNKALVYSVDDNDLWLEKTQSFLANNGMPIDRLSTWAHFQKHNRYKFDLIFHDLGSMKMRAKSLPFVLGLLEEGGVVVLDDMHKRDYRPVAKKEISKAGLSLYSGYKYSLDEITRFSEVAIDDITPRST